MGDISFVQQACTRLLWLVSLALVLASCDDGYSGGQEMATIHYAPIYVDYWGGMTEQQLLSECDQIAVIPASSYTMKRLLQYLESDRPGEFMERDLRVKIEMENRVLFVDHSGVVREHGKPDRDIDWPAIRKFEELFYKIKSPQRRPCKVAS